MRRANQNRAAIGQYIIKAAGNGHALGPRAKIVAVDRNRLPAPDLAGILERSHHFLLLGVHTDNGQPLAGELLALDLPVTELTIPFRALMAGETLAIGAQGVVHLIEQTPNGVGTDRDAQASQLAADLLQTQARPEAPPCHRVARRLFAEQLAQGVLGGHPDHRLQFIGEVTRRGLGHQCGGRVQEGALAGKVNIAVRPQPQLIVMCEGVQRIIGTAMGVAGAIGQGGQFAKDGDGDRWAQRGLEFRQGGHGVELEERLEALGREAVWFHNVSITPWRALSSVILTLWTVGVCGGRYD